MFGTIFDIKKTCINPIHMIKNSTRQQVEVLLKHSMWKLNSEELFITHCYFGFFDHRAMTKEEIGKKLGFDSKQVNSQLHTIMRKLVGSNEHGSIAA